jgi:hypothetical protein
MIDLWPDNISSPTIKKAPVTILREQGTLLGRKTSNLVEGEIRLEAPPTPDHFRYVFYLAAPALGDYRYRLLEILHSADLYKLWITVDESILKELPAEILNKSADGNSKLVSDSEEEFMKILKAIFATEKVRRVIGAIMAQLGEEL